jgi:hypothetical protein
MSPNRIGTTTTPISVRTTPRFRCGGVPLDSAGV